MKKAAMTVALVVVLAAALAAGPAQAQLYQDRITVTIGGWLDQAATTGFNPWGLNEGDTFELILTFDPATILSTVSGYIEFGESSGNSFIAPISGDSGGGTFNETHDMDYTEAPGSASPYGYYIPTGGFNPASTGWDALGYYGFFDTGDLTQELSINTDDGESYLGFYLGGSFWERTLTVNLAGFNPALDRTVAAVPIPGTLLLLGPGVLSLLAFRRRRSQ